MGLVARLPSSPTPRGHPLQHIRDALLSTMILHQGHCINFGGRWYELPALMRIRREHRPWSASDRLIAGQVAAP